MDKTCWLERTEDTVRLSNQRFLLVLVLGGDGAEPVREFRVATAEEMRHDQETGLRLWTGFAGVTSHISDFYLTSKTGAKTGARVAEETDHRLVVEYGPLLAARWEIWWTFTLEAETVAIESTIHVRHQTVTDDEVDVLAFEVPEGDEYAQATFNTGYILPPKDWWKRERPEITYAGNDGFRSPLDRRARLRFSGESHRDLTLHFAGGYGLRVTCETGNNFLLIPRFVEKPSIQEENRLPKLPYRFHSHERFAITTGARKEARKYTLGEVLTGRVVLRLVEPEPVRTLAARWGDGRISDLTNRFQQTHGHSCIGHDAGFSGGWHNAGGERSWSVSFEYFMHSKIHLYSNSPAIDPLMDRALEQMWRYETQPDGLVWRHDLVSGRGGFLEANASVLIFLGDYVRRTGDLKHLGKGRKWARWMLDQFTDDPYLFKSPNSTGVPGAFQGGKITNWWDVIRFGGYDAYANVLAYPALLDMAALERTAGNEREARDYEDKASRLRWFFNEMFWLEDVGRFAAWVDTNGTKHDYAFVPVNVMAVQAGLCDDARSGRVLEGLDRKMAEIGYQGFSLPSNLIAFPPDIYDAGDHWHQHYGYPHFYDPFGIYENGGIWVWVSGYYMAAWGRFNPAHAYEHWVRIAEQYERDNLQGMGNGYFWDPETGRIMEGSRQEPYLSNAAMSVWGVLSLLGIEMTIGEGVRLAPRLPEAMAGASLTFRYRGGSVRFRFHGWGNRVVELSVNGEKREASVPLSEADLADGSVVEVRLNEG